MKTGEILENRYQIVAPLGSGGTSTTFLGQILTGGECAVKVIRCVSERARSAALREAEFLRALHHPAIPKLLDVLQTEEAAVLIMEYIPGVSLSELLNRRGPQPERLVWDWAVQICEVLEYLHSQTPPVVFCDLKPGNLIWVEADHRLVLVDFGAARFSECGSDHRAGFTRRYASPEQYERDRPADQRSDIYCLGTTIYRLLTGSFSDAEQMGRIEEMFPELSGEWSRIISKCTRRNPDERYQRVAQVHSALLELGELCLSGRTVEGLPRACALPTKDEDTQTDEPDTECSEPGRFEILESILLIHTDLSIE